MGVSWRASGLRMWLGAQVVAMLMVGVLIGGGALLIGIPSPFALGLIFGLAEFVPVAGPVVGAIPVLLVAAGQSWEMVLWALGLVVIVQQVESNLIMPLVSGHAVQLPPAVGLFAVVAMGVVFGPLGLRVRRNRLGYVAFLLLYQALCSVASLVGYAQEIAGRRRRWK